MIVRAAFLLAASALLGGCVSFEVAPVAETGCDATLAGRWEQVLSPDGDADRKDRSISVNADCALEERAEDGSVALHPFRTFEFEGHQYIAMPASSDDDEIKTVVDSNGRVIETWPRDRVELYRYRHDGDRILIWAMQTEVAIAVRSDGAVAHSDATIDAETGKPIPGIFPDNVYLSGSRDALAALLRTQGDALYGNMQDKGARAFARIHTRDSK